MALQLGLGGSVPNAEPMQVDIEDERGENTSNYIVENPNLDLETYVNGYSGHMKIKRLLFIAKHAPSLQVDCYKFTLLLLKQSLNVNLYHIIHAKLVEALRSTTNEIISPDLQWIGIATKQAETLLEKLNNDLKGFKNSSIKECIRRGYDDLGSHYLNMGDLNNALKNYGKVRDYCSSARHIVNMCLNVIKVCVYLGNWTHVLTYVNKAENSGLFNEKDQAHILTKLRCSAGLANLGIGKYKAAAKDFLQATSDNCDFPELVSANNITIYGSLCALATFTREELKDQVINCSTFKLLMEMEPNIREILLAFYKSHYSRCLELLEIIRQNALLDIYLSPHIDAICKKIRYRGLVQYFSPYRLADMHRMASTFNCSVAELEDELMPLILDGQIAGRIDSQNKVLQLRKTNQRNLTFAKTLKIGNEYQHRSKALVLRNAAVQCNIQVQSSDIK